MTRHSLIISTQLKSKIYDTYDKHKVMIRRQNMFIDYFVIYHYDTICIRIDNRVIGYQK